VLVYWRRWRSEFAALIQVRRREPELRGAFRVPVGFLVTGGARDVPMALITVAVEGWRCQERRSAAGPWWSRSARGGWPGVVGYALTAPPPLSTTNRRTGLHRRRGASPHPRHEPIAASTNRLTRYVPARGNRGLPQVRASACRARGGQGSTPGIATACRAGIRSARRGTVAAPIGDERRRSSRQRPRDGNVDGREGTSGTTAAT